MRTSDQEMGSNSSQSSSGRSRVSAGERDPSSVGLEGTELDPENRRSSFRGQDDVEDKWSALDKLSSYDRLRSAILKHDLLAGVEGARDDHRYDIVDVRNVDYRVTQNFVDNLFRSSPEADNEAFVRRLRDRMDRAGVELPTVEVRFENLTLDAKCEIGYRSLPTLYNTFVRGVEIGLNKINLSFTKTANLNILHNVSGILKPGRMTLLLGPPGCGKTSVLLALAGQLEHTVNVGGSVTYNGHTFEEFSPVRTGAYIHQTDLHLAEYTVRETMNFSAQYQGVGSRLDLLKETLRRERELGIHPDSDVDFYMKTMASQDACHELATDYMLKILGLEICADTMVGDDMIRGISGGQKKRVTIGEIIVGPARVYFMDEITSGLDSSTAFQIITCLGQLAHQLDMTFLIALLQPAPEVFNLFDDVILLSEGQTVYHGPCDQVVPFFESCGFRCPPRKGIADFLQEVTSRKDQEQYWYDKSKRYRYVSVYEFSIRFRNSPVGVKTDEELATPFDKTKSHKNALVFEEWPVSKKDQYNITYRKELVFLKRNAFIYVFKASQMLVQGLMITSLFLRTNMHRKNLRDASKYNSALFVAGVTVVFNGYTDLILTVLRLPNFYKLRDMKFVPGWAFGLVTLVTRLPFSAIESLSFLAVIYYPIGFAPAAGRFLKILLIVTVAHQMACTLFRALAGLCGTLIMANSVGTMVLVAVYSLGGFIVTRARFKVWWLWGYWASPLTWIVTAVNEVEFLSPQWNERLIPGDTKTLGHRQLHLNGLYAHGYWYWASLGALFLYIVIFNLMFFAALRYTRGPGRPRPVVSAEVLAAMEATRAAEEKFEQLEEIGDSLQSVPRNFSGSRRSDSDRELSRRPSGIELARTSSVDSESLRVRSSLDIVRDAAGVAAKRGMVLPFQPLSMSFENINYFVDMPTEMRERGAQGDKLQLLRGVTGAFRPGILTALVGVTGAGKSTLMDVLIGRKTKGIVEGDIRISGFPKVQETFARIAGYCEQNDIHSPNLTVYESLIFSAWLRLSRDIDDEIKRQFVDEVMDLVELASLAGSIVGAGARSGLSIEQRKRLTIAVELVANPSIIFMDEPTTGLDARAAAIVMRTVRNTVDTGRTVVCTIHQPSIDIFESFDELLLLKQGGQCIYAGPLGRQSHHLIKYFEELPGIPKIRDGYNPATWMLDITTMGMERKLGVDFAEIYENSALYRRTKALVDELGHPPSGSKELSFPDKYSRSYPQQLYSLLWKTNLSYWRLPEYNLLRFAFTLFMGIFYGTLFLHTGQKRASQFNIVQILASVFTSGLMMGYVTATTIQPVIFIERSVSFRERASRMYSSIPFSIAQLLIELPYTLLQSLIYSVLTFSMINLEWKADKFFLYVYFTFAVILMFGYYGMMMVALTPNLQLASILMGFFFNVWNLFGGFLIPKPQIPGWGAWYYWADPLAWMVYGQVVAQFGDLTDIYIPVIGFEEKMSIPHFLKVVYGFRHKWLGHTVAMTAIFPVLFGIVFVVSNRLLNFQNR